LTSCRPEVQRFRVPSKNPIPAITRARDVGSGTVVVDEVKVPENVVGLEVVFVTLIVDSPVSPANAPVPPLNTVTIVTAVMPPLTVPLPVKVPNTVPSG
jgi:hypothetical protein